MLQRISRRRICRKMRYPLVRELAADGIPVAVTCRVLKLSRQPYTRIGQDRSATVVLRAYGVLAGILDVAVRDRRITSNPARGVNLPRKVAKPHVYLTHEQVHRLAAASGRRLLFVFLLAYTGLRWGEAIGLRTRDVDLRRRRITATVNAVEVARVIEIGTPKTHKRRDVPYPPFLSQLMATQIEGKSRDDLVFSGADGQHLRRTRVSTGSRGWFKTALREAEVEPMTLHDIRHTAASLARLRLTPGQHVVPREASPAERSETNGFWMRACEGGTAH